MTLLKKPKQASGGKHYHKASGQQTSRQKSSQSSGGMHGSKATNQPQQRQTSKEKKKTMIFQVGHELEIQGTHYAIIGSIAYEDKEQGDYWEEYRLRNLADQKEHWLSVDHGNAEYEMSFMVDRTAVPDGFRLVDIGTQRVKERHGNVDVDLYETARYYTYEDESEEHTFCKEVWSDETEYSRGMYIEFSDIHDLGETKAAKKAASSSWMVTLVLWLVVLTPLLFILVPDSCSKFMPMKNTNVDGHLATSSSYTLEASASDNGTTAHVFSTKSSVDDTTKDIIRAADGCVQSVQQDSDARTVAILTPNEYILVYEDADADGMGLGDTESANSMADELGSSGDDADGWKRTQLSGDKNNSQTDTTRTTMVQVSNRKYVYTTDRRPYHARYRSYRWYRRFYRSKGYDHDSWTYGKSTSSYGSYTGETVVNTSTSNTYESYAESIRQESVGTSSSSGGGTSFGK